MGYIEDLKFLERYGVNIAKTYLARDWDEGKKIIEEIGFPVVMKISTERPIHKTDVGGVKLVENWDDFDEFRAKVKKVWKKLGVNGLIIQEKLDGIELFIGGKRDPQFGPVVLFGLGGIFVEIIEDVSMRLCPVSKRDAEQMITEIKGYPALAGARGMKPVKMDDLVKAIVGVSKLMLDNPEIKELDINPLFANDKYVKAADVRIIR